MKTICDDCGNEADEDKVRPLDMVNSLFSRIEPGQTVPAGECRKCGSLVYLLAKKTYLARPRIRKDEAPSWRVIQAHTLKRVYQHLAGERTEQDARREFVVHEVNTEVV